MNNRLVILAHVWLALKEAHVLQTSMNVPRTRVKMVVCAMTTLIGIHVPVHLAGLVPHVLQTSMNVPRTRVKMVGHALTRLTGTHAPVHLVGLVTHVLHQQHVSTLKYVF